MCSSREDNVSCILPQYALTVFGDARSSLLESVSKRPALTTSIASLKSDVILPLTLSNDSTGLSSVPEPAIYGVIQ